MSVCCFILCLGEEINGEQCLRNKRYAIQLYKEEIFSASKGDALQVTFLP